MTRLSLKSPTVCLSPTLPTEKGKSSGKKGRKKKKTVEENNFKISDFMDNQV